MKVVVEHNRLPGAEKRARSLIDQALSDGAVETQATAQSLAPVDTGRLRSSIATEREGEMNYAVGTDVEYAVHQEYGTRYQSGKAFMRPSFERHKDEIVANLRKALNNL
jgi:HK97 gp10 family phage protein